MLRQIAADLDIGATVLGCWRRELRQAPMQVFVGHGRSRDEEFTQIRRELARVTKEREFCEKRWQIQPVEATLARSLSAGVSYPNIFLGR